MKQNVYLSWVQIILYLIFNRKVMPQRQTMESNTGWSWFMLMVSNWQRKKNEIYFFPSNETIYLVWKDKLNM